MSVSLMENSSSLTDPWVGRIFDELQATYGSRFADMWSGTNPAAVKAMWGRRLAGFTDRPECLEAALASLDDKPWPPSLPEFISLCRDAARRTQRLALPAPGIDQEQSARRIEHVAATMKMPDAYDWRGWAKRLRARHAAGERLLPVQICLAAAALEEHWTDQPKDPTCVTSDSV